VDLYRHIVHKDHVDLFLLTVVSDFDLADIQQVIIHKVDSTEIYPWVLNLLNILIDHGRVDTVYRDIIHCKVDGLEDKFLQVVFEIGVHVVTVREVGVFCEN
jgi:hypothetical protein